MPETGGDTKRSTYRLDDETKARLRRVADHHGLETETAAIRFLAKKEDERITRERGRNGPQV